MCVLVVLTSAGPDLTQQVDVLSVLRFEWTGRFTCPELPLRGASQNAVVQQQCD